MTFVPGPHDSHKWNRFDGALFCEECEVCTCHSPVASTERCDGPIVQQLEVGDSDE